MPGYPIELDLRGERTLVVGLGAVGRRKAGGLAEAGATVVGIDPAPPPLEDLPERITVLAEPYRAAHLDGILLAWASATPDVNRIVVRDARAAGVWVGSASDPASGQFRLPAIWRDGPLLLTVSTSGATPALASALRDRAAAAIGPEAAGLVALIAAVRPSALALIENPEARRRVLADWADPRWLDRWRAEGPEAVRRQLMAAIHHARVEPEAQTEAPGADSRLDLPGV